MLDCASTPLVPQARSAVRVQLASDVLGDDPMRQCRVDLELLTAYEAIGRFSRQLRELIEGTVATARLDGDRLE